MGSAETLQACLAIDLVVAWRIFRLTKLSETMDRVDLWRARQAMKTLRKDQRAAIAEAAED